MSTRVKCRRVSYPFVESNTGLTRRLVFTLFLALAYAGPALTRSSPLWASTSFDDSTITAAPVASDSFQVVTMQFKVRS